MLLTHVVAIWGLFAQTPAGPEEAVRLAIAAGLQEATRFSPAIGKAAHIFVDAESFRIAAKDSGSVWGSLGTAAGSRGSVKAAAEVRTCVAPNRCSIAVDEILVVAKSVSLSASGGIVTLAVEWRDTGHRLPAIGFAEVIVSLAREGERWTVTGTKLGTVT